MDDSLAPILLFVYNRPWHTRQTLEALAKNQLSERSRLFIFADGPKGEANGDQLGKIKEVREIIREKKWCGEIEIVESKINLGIEISEVRAITEKVNAFGKVIVLEDDLVTAPFFLRYMNEALNVYQNSDNVYAVNGYMFPVPYPRQKGVLLPITSAWGWGTWKEKWAAYDPELKNKEAIINSQDIKSRFNLGDLDYTLLFDHPDKPWDIRWYYSVFVRNGLCLFPTQSLVKNIGMDGSGTHYKGVSETSANFLSDQSVDVELLQDVDFDFYAKYIQYFKTKRRSMPRRAFNYLKRLVGR